MSPRFRHLVTWVAPPAVFVLLASLWLDLPGPGPDEALFAQVLFPDPPGGPAWRMSVFRHDVPVMLMPYLGGLKAWLYQPLVAVFGTGPAVLRLPMILLGAATIFLFQGLVKRWAGAAAATFTSWLLATDPTFLWTTRCDWGPATLQRFLSVAGCGLVWWWWRSGGLWRLFLGFFLFGLGLFDKLTFHWLLLGYAAAAVYLGQGTVDKGRVWDWRRKIQPAAAAVALTGFLLGASPYLAYRLQSGPQGPDLIWETDLARYEQKWGMLVKTLDGTVARGFMTAYAAPAPGRSRGPLDDALEAAFGPELQQGAAVSLFPWAVGAALLLLPWTPSLGARFAAVFCLTGLAAMAPIRDAGAVHHQALLLPYPQLLVGAALAWWAARGKGRRYASVAVFGIIFASNLVTLGSLYRDALRLGGGAHWSEAAYELAAYLGERDPRFAVSLDWGVDNPQRWLLAHDPPVQPLAFPWDWADRGTVQRLQEEMRQGGVLFVGRAEEADRLYPESWSSASAAAEEAGFTLDLVHAIRDRQGRAIFHVLEPHAAENRLH